MESTPRKRPILPDKRLVVYGVAAGAALAGSAAPADANLITLDLTGLPTADRTSFFTGTTHIPSLYFDVNAANAALAVAHNTFLGADFHVLNESVFAIPPYGGFSRQANIRGIDPANGIAFTGGNQAVAFATSNFVGRGGAFVNSAFVAGTYKGVNGGLSPGTTTYLGLKFLIGSDSHFGWVNLTVNPDLTLTLNALGYESVANTPAHVQPAASGVPDQGSTLALLAIGATGLLAFRRQQQKAA